MLNSVLLEGYAYQYEQPDMDLDIPLTFPLLIGDEEYETVTIGITNKKLIAYFTDGFSNRRKVRVVGKIAPGYYDNVVMAEAFDWMD